MFKKKGSKKIRRAIASLVLLTLFFNQTAASAAPLVSQARAKEQLLGSAARAVAEPIVSVAKAKIASFFGLAKAKAAVEQVGLVAVLVDQSLFQNMQEYEGLRMSATEELAKLGLEGKNYNSQLAEKTLSGRVSRYAIDVQKTQERTKSLLVQVPRSATPVEIADALEKLYYEGDGTKNEINHLSGVVLIGDVAIPVVNKNGNRFISLFPYTDFDDKVYIYNPETDEYEYNADTTDPKPEVWHGVMKPPGKDMEGNVDANKLLAIYLDKNHLFHLNHPDFANFEKKIMFSDILGEKNGGNTFIYDSYERFLENWENIAYMRFDKFLADKIYKEAEEGWNEVDYTGDNDEDGQLDEDMVNGVDDDEDGLVDEDPPPSEPLELFDKEQLAQAQTDMMEEYGGDLSEDMMSSYMEDFAFDPDNQFASIPDIQTKGIIWKYFKRFQELFKKHIGNIHKWTEYSGRWDTDYPDGDGKRKNDVDTLMGLISKKDEYTLWYLKQVNDVVDAKLDELAENDLQKKLYLPYKIKFSGTVKYELPDDDDEDTDAECCGSDPLEEVVLINSAYQIPEGKQYLHGKEIEEVMAVEDCVYTRGSENDGQPKKMEVLSIFNFDALQMKPPLDEIKAFDRNGDGQYSEEEGEALRDRVSTEVRMDGGCNYFASSKPEMCFPLKAKRPIIDVAGTNMQKDAVPNDITASGGRDPDTLYDDYRACLDLKERDYFYYNYLLALARYLDAQFGGDGPDSPPTGVYLDLGREDLLYSRSGLAEGPYFEEPDNGGRLYNDRGYKVTVKKVLVDYMGIDANLNPRDMLIEFMEKPYLDSGSYHKDIKTPGGACCDVTDLDLSISKTGKEISSVYKHIEPTVETINAQIVAQASRDLPIDNPRYITFQDKARQPARIDYPNIFDESVRDLAAFRAILQVTGDEIAALPEGTAFKNILVSLIGPELDPDKIEDALKWRRMNIDDKHDYVLKKYLSPTAEPYVAKRDKGYEALYFVAASQSPDDLVHDPFDLEGLDLSALSPFNLGMTFNFGEPKEEMAKEKSKRKSSAADNVSGQGGGGGGSGGDDGDGGPVIIWSWLSEMMAWVSDLQNIGVGASCDCGSGDGQDITEPQSYDEIAAIDKDFDGIPDDVDQHPTDPDTNNDGIIDGATYTQSLTLSAEQNLFLANGQDEGEIRLTVLDDEGKKAETDSYTMVRLEANTDKHFRIVSPNPSRVRYGQVVFKVLSTREPGSTVFTAKTENLKTTVVSNQLALQSSKRKVKLSVYEWVEQAVVLAEDSPLVSPPISTGANTAEKKLTEVVPDTTEEDVTLRQAQGDSDKLYPGMKRGVIKEQASRVEGDMLIMTLKEFNPQITVEEIDERFLHLKGEIFDEQGEFDADDNTSIVHFKVINGDATVAEEKVKARAGIAETDLVLTTRAGNLEFTAEVINKEIPVVDTDVYLASGEPASLTVTPLSTVIKAGGLSKTPVKVEIKDKFGNIANADLYRLTFNLRGGGFIDALDEDDEQVGTQINTLMGVIWLDVISSENPGILTLKAELEDLKGEATIEVLPEIKLKLEAQVVESAQADGEVSGGEGEAASDIGPMVVAGAETSVLVSATAMDAANQPLNNFNAEISFMVPDPLYGEIEGLDKIMMQNGRATATFKPNTKAGKAYITGSTLGIEPDTTKVTILPAEPEYIKVSSPKPTIATDTDEKLPIWAKLYDIYDNFVYTENGRQVTYKITPVTRKFGSLQGSSEGQPAVSAATVNGRAKAVLTSTDITGPINIQVYSSGLITDVLGLKSQRNFGPTEIQEMQPQAMLVSLLGNPAGKVTKENYLGGWMTFTGKVQAMVGLLMDPKAYERILDISPTGRITLLGHDLEAKVIPANSEEMPLRIVLYDFFENQNLVEMMVKTDPTQGFGLIRSAKDLAGKTEGVYLLRQAEPESEIEYKSKGDQLSVTEERMEVMRLTKDGRIKLFSNDFRLQINPEIKKYLGINLVSGADVIATVIYKYHFPKSVEMLPWDFEYEDFETLEPGTYVKPLNFIEKYYFQRAYYGNSSRHPQGLFVVNREKVLSEDQQPGLTHISLEDTEEHEAVGFVGHNKFMLLFAAGATIGEANLPYASDIGVILGDPLTALKTGNSVSQSSFYTQDVGEMILASNKTPTNIMPFDYNNDNLEDLIIPYPDGEVKLLMNTLSNPRFKDMGKVLEIVSETRIAEKIDFNLDGYDDLIVSTQESCLQGEECFYLFENEKGRLVRKNLPLVLANERRKIEDLKVGDMNNDGYEDIVASDSAGSIYVFYNKKGEIQLEGQLVDGLDVKLDSTLNLALDVLVHYEGMPEPQQGVKVAFTSNETVDFVATTDTPDELKTALTDTKVMVNKVLSKTGPNFTMDTSGTKKQVEKEFGLLGQNADLGGSIKQGFDENGGIVEPGDFLKFEITLKNNSGRILRNVMIADTVNPLISVTKNNFVFEGFTAEEASQIEIEKSSLKMQPYLIKNLTLVAGAERKITYRAEVKQLPTVKINLGNNMGDYPIDNFLDIRANPENNTSGRIVYYYSNGKTTENGIGKISYAKKISDPPDPETTPKRELGKLDFGGGNVVDINYQVDLNGNGMPDDLETDADGDGMPDKLKELKTAAFTNDKDEDGLYDYWDDSDGGSMNLDDIADGIENAIASFNCDAGCFPMPINYAFMAPGTINIMGVPGGVDPGFPILAIGGIPSLITIIAFLPIWPPDPAWMTSTAFRLYMAPTLTGGLGTVMCTGPYPGMMAPCWVFAAPLNSMGGACDEMTANMEADLASVNNANSSIQSGVSALNLGGGGTGNVPGSTWGSNGMMNYELGNYSGGGDFGVKFSIPGFPAIIPPWLKRQSELAWAALTDAPDIYIMYPDFASLGGDLGDYFKNSGKNMDEVESYQDLITFLNSMPMLQIRAESVLIKVPALTKKEWEHANEYYSGWIADSKKELEEAKAEWKILFSKNPDWKAMGDKMDLDAGKLIRSVEDNLAVLQEYRDFPYTILDYLNIEAKYVSQLICYLDTISMMTGGWLKKNIKRYYAWLDAIDQLIQAIMTWMAIINLMLDFMMECDQCTNDRGTILELLMKLLIVIPPPPDLPIPKWPDIVIDVHDIQAGVAFTMPKIKFKPVPIMIPRIPPLKLPRVPNIKIKLPELPVLPGPPQLPPLPDLPPLPTIKLPDLPPPPEIPDLMAAIEVVINALRTILRILCMILQVLMPIPEMFAKTQVEKITERGLSPLLPFDMALKLEFPKLSIDFVDRIEVKTHLVISPKFTFITDMLKETAKEVNKVVENLVDKVKEITKDAEDIGSAVMDMVPGQDLEEDMNFDLSSFKDNIDELEEVGKRWPMLKGPLKDLEEQFNEFSEVLEGQQKLLAKQPEQYHLKVKQETWEAPEEDLNKMIAEIKQRGVDWESLESPIVSPAQKRIIALKTDLIKVQGEYEEFNQKIEQSIQDGETEQFWSLIAARNEVSRFEDAPYLLASEGEEPVFNSVWPEDFGPEDFGPDVTLRQAQGDKIQQKLSQGRIAFKEEQEKLNNRLLAIRTNEDDPAIPLPPGPPVPGTPPSGAPAEVMATIDNISPPMGMFIYNEEKQINERLIKNMEELDLPTLFAFGDFDLDKDEDIIYSLAGDVYLKENHERTPPQVFYSGIPKVVSLIDLVPPEPSVNRYRFSYVNNGLVSLNWKQFAAEEVLGYEIEYGERLEDFETTDTTGTVKIHVLPKETEEKEELNLELYSTVNYQILKGEVQTDTAGNYGHQILMPGDDIFTDNRARADLRWLDMTTITLDEETYFAVPEPENPETLTFYKGKFEVVAGSAEHPIFESGMLYEARKDVKELNVTFFDGTKVSLNPPMTFTVPDFATGEIVLKDPNGAQILALPREKVKHFFKTEVSNGDKLHTLKDSRLIVRDGAAKTTWEVELKANRVFPISADSSVELKEGEAEIIRTGKEREWQEIYDDMLMEWEDKVSLERGGKVKISYEVPGQAERAEFEIKEEGEFRVAQLGNLEEPSYEIRDIENGNYFGQVKILNKNGERGVVSQTILFPPQLCADKTPPFVLLNTSGGTGMKRVPIFRTITLDGSNSFDMASEIIAHNWDLDQKVDSDGDGDEANDVDATGQQVTLGPFDEPRNIDAKLTILDEAYNEATRTIQIEVFVPEIYLNKSSALTNNVEGYIDPPIANYPVVLGRKRDENWDLLLTPTADEKNKYYTDADGKFLVTDLFMDERLSLKNLKGQEVAGIDAETGRIMIEDKKYRVKVMPAEFPLPTRFVVQDEKGQALITQFQVPEINTDVKIMYNPEFEFERENTEDFQGVFVKDSDPKDDFELRKIPVNDPLYPGAVEIWTPPKKQASVFDIAHAAEVKPKVKPAAGAEEGAESDEATATVAEEKSKTVTAAQLAVVASDGNIYLVNPEGELRLKATANEKDPMVIEIVYKKKARAEVFVATPRRKGVELVSPVDLPFSLTDEGGLDTDKDGLSDSYERTYHLNPFLARDAGADLDHDGLTNLEESQYGTNLDLADTDEDEIPDGFEVKYGLDPLNPKDAYDDLDGDKINNLKEFNNGSDPTQKPKTLRPKVDLTLPANITVENPLKFSDVATNDPLYDTLMRLIEKGILQGYVEDDKTLMKLERDITRAEFTKIILAILCIVPRPEAYEAPAVFKDIIYRTPLPWYFDETKESYLRGLITGYKAERDPETGLTPFKPEHSISVAETAKIILEALEMQKIIRMKDNDIQVKTGEVWYDPYLRIAQDLKPHLTFRHKNADQVFILTKEEAADPAKLLTRRDMVAITERVFNFYDCFKEDDDGDGMPNYWEERYSLNPLDKADANQDADFDGLTNRQEYDFGTDPLDPDTDDGGISDYNELLLGLNPLDKRDEQPGDRDGDGLMDVEEVEIYKTDPDNPDTDFGGIGDGTEVWGGTDPLDPRDDGNDDWDGDGLKNREESLIGTDPWNPDTDDGGVSDYAEYVERGLNPLNKKDDKSVADDFDDDPDGDGLSNQQEKDFGSDPLDPDTDDGGYSDGLEYKLKTDPNDGGDDDIDGDGLTNSEEDNIYKTDKFNPDTDNGGVWDGQEVKEDKTDPLKAGDDDWDGEGLTDREEDEIYGTDKYNPDTDNGGVSDYDEVMMGTNPLETKDDDTDGDGLTDREEDEVYGTDKFNPDTDGGGVSEGQEVAMGTDPLVAKDDDSDGDGLTDSEEDNIYKTDKFNPDTDEGGISDGQEVLQDNTDPLKGVDDKGVLLENPLYNLGAGTYVSPLECVTCPCPVRLENEADLIREDEIFGAVMDWENSYIHAKSNQLTYEKVRQ